MSPHIDISINSIGLLYAPATTPALTDGFEAYDETNLTLYVNMSQIFRIFVIPFYQAPVTLTTVLQLEKGQNLNQLLPSQKSLSTPLLSGETKYYIRSQNDLYQIDQFIRFALPWGIGTTIILIWHWIATLCCIVGAKLGAPLRSYNQAAADRRPRYPDVPLEEGEEAEKEMVLLNGATKEPNGDWAATLRNVAANERTLLDLQQRHR